MGSGEENVFISISGVCVGVEVENERDEVVGVGGKGFWWKDSMKGFE